MNNHQDRILKRILDDLVARYSDNIITIYGIGSYFDDTLPLKWVKNDLDIVVIVKTLKNIPKQDWTEIRYKKKEINGNHVWLGFNTIEAYQDRYTFNKQSVSNYEWSLIEIKHPENSKLLYGKDIRGQLPSTNDLIFDYDDVLARGLYHLDKSLSEKKTSNAMKSYSKAVFKTGFYLCIYFDKNFRATSILEIGKKLKQVSEDNNFLEKVIEFFEEVIIYRIIGQFKTDFNELRNEFITYIFSLLGKGTLHRKMDYYELVRYITGTFSGFPFLNQKVQKFALFNNSRIRIKDLTVGMRDVMITGLIEEIFRTYKFNRDDGTIGKVASFLISDSTGQVRVVLWDEQVKIVRNNDFNVGRTINIVNGYIKQGKTGIEIYVSTFGKINFLPEDEKQEKLRNLTKRDITKRLDFIKDLKSQMFPCPHCGFLCPPSRKSCGKCGDLLPKK